LICQASIIENHIVEFFVEFFGQKGYNKAMISDTIKEAVAKALSKLGISKGDFAIEHPDELSHGDYSTNAALVFGKELKVNPRELADKLVAELLKKMPDQVEKIDIAGPGFINFHLKREFFAEQVKKILKEDEKFGSNDSFNKTGLKKVMIEYTDPNPFKEFHIGHLMSNAIGESIARITEFSGAEVRRACYQGDVGLHVAKAIWGYLQSSKKDISSLCASDFAVRFGIYYASGAKAYEENESAKKDIIGLNKKIYSREDKDLNDVYDIGKKISLDYFDLMYKKLGTAFDFFFYESEAGPIGRKIVLENLEKGVFEKSDGAIVFKGDEGKGLHTRVFINSEGLPTYEAKELGLVELKREKYNYDLSLVVTGNEIKDYFKVLLDAVSKVFSSKDSKGTNILHIPHGMLRLPSGKMSSRTGDVVTALSLIAKVKKSIEEKHPSGTNGGNESQGSEQIAIGAIKYSILRQSSGDDIVFDLDKSISFEGDSGPYLQYATVRAKSILKKAQEAEVKESTKKSTESIHELEKTLYRFPEIVERSAREYEPHYITTYLTELAGLFNNYYANNQIISVDDKESPYKIALTHAFLIVMRNGLTLLGIQVPEKM
jgi:arginyl-tRNA synthetase